MAEIRIKAKSFFLLFSFLGVQVISIGCTFSNYINNLSHEHSSSDTHHEHNHYHHNNSTNDKTKSESEKEKCCIENTSIFLSGIEVIPSTNHWLKPLNSIQFITFLDDRTDSVCFFESIIKEIRPPPFSMVCSTLFRIVIQSIQI